jgi:polyphosphate kinase 2
MINYDVSEYDRLNSDLYRKEKRSLQIEFLKLQNWAIKEEKKIAVVFEGRDTAGKTDTINLLARHLIPDHFRYVHLGIPTPNESKKWFKRYERHMPKKGEIVFFDRSWYTRATVEITMGYCSKRQYTHFMNKVVRWEKSYIEEDLILIKFYLSIEKKQQSKRIKQRQNDPLKLWKLSPNDLRMADKWEIFSFFKEQMFSNTSYEQSPWIVINANNKMVARLTALRYLLNEIDYEGKKLSKPKTWDVGINNYKIEHKGVEFTGLTYQQLKLLQKLIQNQSN